MPALDPVIAAYVETLVNAPVDDGKAKSAAAVVAAAPAAAPAPAPAPAPAASKPAPATGGIKMLNKTAGAAPSAVASPAAPQVVPTSVPAIVAPAAPSSSGDERQDAADALVQYVKDNGVISLKVCMRQHHLSNIGMIEYCMPHT